EGVDRAAGRLDDARDGGVVGDVGGHGRDLPLNLGGELVESLLRDVDGDDATALAGDTGCRGAPDAGARARHDDGLAREASRADALDPLGALDGSRRHALLGGGLTLGRTGCRGIRAREGNVARG